MTLDPGAEATRPAWQRRLGAAADAAVAGLDLLLAIMLAVLVVSLVYQVFGRYVLNSAPGWTEEVARFLVVYITMLGAAAVIRRDGHVQVSVLVDALSPAVRHVVMWIRDLVVLAAAGILAWYGYGFAVIGARRLSPALEISMYWPHLAIPLSGALIALFLALRRLAPPETDPGVPSGPELA